MKHKFSAISEQRFPVKGDLIRNPKIGDFINIVLEVTNPTTEGCPFVRVRSVRYGQTNGGNFLLLNGRRSRWFKFFKDNVSPDWDWHIVEEFVALDNQALKDSILKDLEGVDTTFRVEDSEGDE